MGNTSLNNNVYRTVFSNFGLSGFSLTEKNQRYLILTHFYKLKTFDGHFDEIKSVITRVMKSNPGKIMKSVLITPCGSFRAFSLQLTKKTS